VGGVFYSIHILPSPWQEISHANPLFYIVDGIRYGFLGSSDVSFGLAFPITCALAAALFLWSVWLFASGHKLKP
jgi:ABC-2 type transport system permease protein